jgi:type IV secretion system protein VirD4
MNIKEFTPFLKKRILPNLAYLFIFWFGNKAGEAYRITDGADIIQKLLNTANKLNSVMSNPMLSFNTKDLFVGPVATIIIYFIVYSKKKNAKKYRKNAEYGSARWGNAKDIAPYTDPISDKNIILTATESLTLNGRPKNPKYARNKNVLVIGGSGSGKTRFFVKPNLLQLHSSYVCTDPKGLIY